MKATIVGLIASILLLGSALAGAKPAQEYIRDAQQHQQSGYLRESIETMEEAVREHPESSDAHAYLGLFLGMSAGKTNDMKEAMSLIERSFASLDKAVALDPENPLAHLQRGIIALNVPDFFGKSEIGIEDLEFAVKEVPAELSAEHIVTAYDLLGTAYQKRGDLDMARDAWEEIMALAPGTDVAKNAEQSINQLAQMAEKKRKLDAQKQPESDAVKALRKEIEKDPGNTDLLLQLGEAYYEEGLYDEAEETLKEAVALDAEDVAAHKLLAMVLSQKAGQGYDEKIYEDTDYRTNLAFAVMQALDKGVALDPKDIELRLWRGIMGVQMPFFVQKLDQGIEDLKTVVGSDADESTRAEALYWLGRGYRKMSATAWIEVVSKYSDSQAAKMAFEAMKPDVPRLDIANYVPPFLIVDFVLGFQDELEPQTAVWIENAAGDFVKTLYVSGFAGFVKERQITLPIWASSSNFADVDAVTGASIDLGHHIYIWDLKDPSGNTVTPGKYVVKVEVSYWPSLKYQLALAAISLEKDEDRVVVEDGSYIPYLEVTYSPATEEETLRPHPAE